jgi:S1-C subfamily serine protease
MIILSIVPESPAESAGLRGFEQTADGTFVPGDVLLLVEKRAVRSLADLESALDRYKPGDTVTCTLWNRGVAREVAIRLE